MVYGFYFMVYLPDQQRQQLEMEIQKEVDKTSTLQTSEYANHLAKLRKYLQLAEGNDIQQEVLTNKRAELQRAID